jgi:hypothetical protein
VAHTFSDKLLRDDLSAMDEIAHLKKSLIPSKVQREL